MRKYNWAYLFTFTAYFSLFAFFAKNADTPSKKVVCSMIALISMLMAGAAAFRIRNPD